MKTPNFYAKKTRNTKKMIIFALSNNFNITDPHLFLHTTI